MAKKFLYSVRLSRDAKSIILDSLKDLFDATYQKAESRRILDLIVEFSKVVDNGDRIFLSSGSWLWILVALRDKFLVTPTFGSEQLRRFKILGIAQLICKVVEMDLGACVYTFKPWRFFAAKH